MYINYMYTNIYWIFLCKWFLSFLYFLCIVHDDM